MDEAQDVLLAKFDKDIVPMTASTHATRVFWGTAWTSNSLLGRELREAEAAEAHDGMRRVFRLTAAEVGAEVPAYRATVEEAVRRLGRSHPLVKTQYFSEEIDALGGLFPPERIQRMQARVPSAAAMTTPADRHFALLLDVAGADEGVRGADGSLSLANPARDATALTLVEVLPGTAGTLPLYVPRMRRQWIGADAVALERQVRQAALDWRAEALVVDATGVGAGLAAMLSASLPGRVTPFTFNTASKSRLGWDFLGLVDAGRWQEGLYPLEESSDQARWQREFFAQLAACQFEVLPGPEQQLRWSVPGGMKDAQSGQPLHDDWIFSAALAVLLDGREWNLGTGPALIVPGRDPLREMDGKY